MQHSPALRLLTARFRNEEHHGRKGYRGQTGTPTSRVMAAGVRVAWPSIRGNGDCVYAESAFARCRMGTSRRGCGYRACDNGSLGENLPRASCLRNLGERIELSDGHAVGLPQAPVSRPDAVISLLFCAVGAAISVTFARRKLHATDRVALFAFVFCFFWQAADPKIMRIALGTGLGLLLFAWLYDHFRHRRSNGSRSASHVTAL